MNDVLLSFNQQIILNTFTKSPCNWISDNNAVASVDNNGICLGISFGHAVITATPLNGDSLEYFNVAVIENGEFTVIQPANSSNNIINISSFGASPNLTDNTDNFKNAISFCSNQTIPTTLLVPNGVYKFSQGVTINFNDLIDFTFDGQNSEFIQTNGKLASPFFNVSNCNKINFKNFILDVDWSYLRIASLGYIVNVTSNSFDMNFIDLNLSNQNDIRMILNKSNWLTMNRVDQLTLSPGIPGGVELWNLNNKINNIIQINGSNSSTFRITLNNPIYSIALNNYYLLRHYEYGGVSMVLNKNTNCSLNNIFIYSGPGMGFVISNKNKYIDINGCKVCIRPNSNRNISTAADAFHIPINLGFLRIQNCNIGGQGDDAINIFDGNSTGIQRIDSNGNFIALNVYSFNISFNPGDIIEFRNADFSPTNFTSTIISCTYNSNSHTCQIQLKDPLPIFQNDSTTVIFNNIYNSNNIIIRNNYIHEHRGRGILLQKGNALIEKNFFYRIQGNGILITSGCNNNGQGEGTGCNNSIIRNNIFANISCGDWGSDILFNFYQPNKITSFTFPIHQNIILFKNYLFNSIRQNISIQSSSNVNIKENIIFNNSLIPISVGNRGQMYTSLSQNITFDTNRWLSGNGGYIPNPLILIDYTTTQGIIQNGNIISNY
jgi:hypothetical protein